MDFIYKELALDASAVSNPVMQQRLELIDLGETGLMADLRELNPGKRNDKFDMFFQTLQEIVENTTVADDRRHR
ncbi:hypothetical protein DPMN_155745 [Dreissena polymorpha]|uniref:Uncharacterized protein n=1 Tax=Dreissena polymorpha TaxID=45954 RepID=A0A9D4FPE6_DREPO|nr:hypothetical protein DPMN_155745 [Dreissena polymorpha]